MIGIQFETYTARRRYLLHECIAHQARKREIRYLNNGSHFQLQSKPPGIHIKARSS